MYTMCGRFTLATPLELVEQMLQIEIAEYEPRYNIAPSQPVLSIISDGEKRRAGYLQWGLVPSWVKDPKIGYKMINARGETVHEKPAFKRLLSRRRCLIVADGFYEWKRIGEEKRPYRITVNDSVFTLAGLWDRWRHEDEEIVSCTIITTKPNELMSDIHDRMPVIVAEEDRETWLNPTINDPQSILSIIKPYSAKSMHAYEVSPLVNNPRHNDVECIRSLA
ncbi:SOS response-associated peptidase [Alkalihalobacillus sp. LMS39]|uniref:SOS response-associated peptidase n=1 Tax=Alkalihalobacillus sp. LMS39 TaxID=2924032 RepID=UPI00325FE1F0